MGSFIRQLLVTAALRLVSEQGWRAAADKQTSPKVASDPMQFGRSRVNYFEIERLWVLLTVDRASPSTMTFRLQWRQRNPCCYENR